MTERQAVPWPGGHRRVDRAAVSIGAPLVPLIARVEGVSLATAQWALTGSFLVAGVVAPLLGRLGVGRRLRPVLLVTLVLGLLGGLLAALHTGIWGILAGRALQGFAYAVAPCSSRLRTACYPRTT